MMLVGSSAGARPQTVLRLPGGRRRRKRQLDPDVTVRIAVRCRQLQQEWLDPRAGRREEFPPAPFCPKGHGASQGSGPINAQMEAGALLLHAGAGRWHPCEAPRGGPASALESIAKDRLQFLCGEETLGESRTACARAAGAPWPSDGLAPAGRRRAPATSAGSITSSGEAAGSACSSPRVCPSSCRMTVSRSMWPKASLVGVARRSAAPPTRPNSTSSPRRSPGRNGVACTNQP